jgi:hypothetical protein
MGSRAKREARMMRVPTGRSNTPVPIVAPASDYLVLNGDGTVSVDPTRLEVPQNLYVAKHAWVEPAEDAISLFFAQSAPNASGNLLSCVEVEYQLERFHSQLWEPSREFHERLRANVSRLPAVKGRRETTDVAAVRTKEAEQYAFVAANYSFFVQSGSQATLDFYLLPPNSAFLYEKTKDLSRLVFEPKVRVHLSAHELLRLMDACAPFAEDLGQQSTEYDKAVKIEIEKLKAGGTP